MMYVLTGPGCLHAPLRVIITSSGSCVLSALEQVVNGSLQCIAQAMWSLQRMAVGVITSLNVSKYILPARGSVGFSRDDDESLKRYLRKFSASRPQLERTYGSGLSAFDLVLVPMNYPSQVCAPIAARVCNCENLD
jgi:hypothetical protein